MSDQKLAMLFFDIGFILMIISMILGPFSITNWSLTTGLVACFLALASLFLSFLNWEEPPVRKHRKKKKTGNVKSPISK